MQSMNNGQTDTELPLILLGPESGRIVADHIEAQRTEQGVQTMTDSETPRVAFSGVILRTNGKVDRVSIESLEDMQSAVGGHIELLPTASKKHGFDIYINETGRLEELPINMTACLWLLRNNIYPGLDMPVHGDVLIAGPVGDDGYNTSVSDDIMETIPVFWVEPSFEVTVLD